MPLQLCIYANEGRFKYKRYHQKNMTEHFNLIPAEELFATEIGISGTPLPSNGPGRKNPYLKYIIVGGIVIGSIVIAYHLHKQTIPKVIPRKNDN